MRQLTHTHQRVEGSKHLFRWQRDKRWYRFGFESSWVLAKLVMGHMMRRGVWGQG